MNADNILLRLRRFMLALAGLLFLGTLTELFFIEHTEEPAQFIPFGLCALGLVMVALALLRPRRGPLLALRASAALILLGSLFGMWQHIEGNLGFALEINPGASGGALLAAALGGAAPLLAPGVLALAGVLAVAATYYHPALQPVAAATPAASEAAGRGEAARAAR